MPDRSSLRANTGVHRTAFHELDDLYSRDFNETVAREQAPAPDASQASASAAVPDRTGTPSSSPGAAGRLSDHADPPVLSAGELAAAIRVFRRGVPVLSQLQAVLVRAEWALERQG